MNHEPEFQASGSSPPTGSVEPDRYSKPLTMSIATLRWLNTGNAGGRTGKTKPIKYGRAELNWLHQHGLRWVDKQRKGRGRKTAPSDELTFTTSTNADINGAGRRPSKS